MDSQKYYWSGPGVMSVGKKKIAAGEELEGVSESRIKELVEQGKASTEKTVTARQLSELEQLREQVEELKKGGDSAEVEKLKAENAELKAQLEELTAPSEPEAEKEKGKPGPKPKGN